MEDSSEGFLVRRNSSKQRREIACNGPYNTNMFSSIRIPNWFPVHLDRVDMFPVIHNILLILFVIDEEFSFVRA